MTYDLLAYIGRFQPFHLGHKSVVDSALQQAERVLLIIGSANSPRTARNPFTADERIAMIRSCFSKEDAARLICIPQEDHPYNHDRWLSEVSSKISATAHAKWKADSYRIGVIGVEKDNTSFYLRHFPQFESIEVTPTFIINATDIRAAYFFEQGHDKMVYDADKHRLLDRSMLAFLDMWQDTHAREFHDIASEWKFVNDYKKSWGNAPYPPTFVTVDAVVTNAGHVLLVTRDAAPGRGLFALPGGFVNPGEKLKDGMLRELKEETQIKVPSAVLRGSIVNSAVFDDPQRSSRGRTITHAYHIKLDEHEMPKIRGGDDAARARWVPLGNLRRDQLFEDHYDIIETLVGI